LYGTVDRLGQALLVEKCLLQLEHQGAVVVDMAKNLLLQLLEHLVVLRRSLMLLPKQLLLQNHLPREEHRERHAVEQLTMMTSHHLLSQLSLRESLHSSLALLHHELKGQ
jgi:hypothetical protein